MYIGSETFQISTDFKEMHFPLPPSPLLNLKENVLTVELYAITKCCTFLLEHLQYVLNAKASLLVSSTKSSSTACC